jgi:carbon starvation protein CstA
MTSASALLGIGALGWVYFVRPISTRNYSIETLGLLFSLVGVIAGFAVREKHKHRYFGLSLAAAAWLLMLFMLAASTY